MTAADLELTEALDGIPMQTLKEARESAEREIVQDALRRNKWKITARGAGTRISRTLYELWRSHVVSKGLRRRRSTTCAARARGRSLAPFLC